MLFFIDNLLINVLVLELDIPYEKKLVEHLKKKGKKLFLKPPEFSFINECDINNVIENCFVAFIKQIGSSFFIDFIK